MSADLAKTPVPIENGIVQINSLEGAFRYAQYVHASGLAPSGFKSPEAILIAMQMGAELGLRPMQSLQNIAVINGKAGIYGKALPGIVMQTGALEKFEEWWEGEGDTLVACCRVKRKGVPEERVEKFSVADAKVAGLWNKKTREGGPTPWVLYPRDMLRNRARSRAFVLFADILCGLISVEEIRDIPTDATPEVALVAPSADPLLKQAVGAVVEDSDEKKASASGATTSMKVDQKTASGEQTNREFLEAEQKKNDAALSAKQKEMADKGDTGGKKKPKPPKDDAPAPEINGEKTYKCVACQDTGENSKGHPCPICQKPDKASGDGFKKKEEKTGALPDDPFSGPQETEEEKKQRETLELLEAQYEGCAGLAIPELKKRCTTAWGALNEDQKKSVFAGLHIKGVGELKTYNELQFRKFIEECLSVFKADTAK